MITIPLFKVQGWWRKKEHEGTESWRVGNWLQDWYFTPEVIQAVIRVYNPVVVIWASGQKHILHLCKHHIFTGFSGTQWLHTDLEYSCTYTQSQSVTCFSNYLCKSICLFSLLPSFFLFLIAVGGAVIYLCFCFYIPTNVASLSSSPSSFVNILSSSFHSPRNPIQFQSFLLVFPPPPLFLFCFQTHQPQSIREIYSISPSNGGCCTPPPLKPSMLLTLYRSVDLSMIIFPFNVC